MRRLPLLARRRFGPGFLEADVNSGVDNGAAFDLSTRQEDELRLVKDAFGRHLRLRFVVHV